MTTMNDVVRNELYRQWRKLILIPSESMCSPAASRMLSSPFSSIYAEGQPEPPLMHDPRESADDPVRFESWQTRLADGRFYKGCLNADIVELTAKEHIARAFTPAAADFPIGDVMVNVQPLSGAAAKLMTAVILVGE